MSKFNYEQLKNGRLFSVKFIKKDGSERTMLARLGVKKGINGKGLNYNPDEHNYLIVYSIHDKAYRTVNKNTVLQIKANGVTYKHMIA